MSIYSYIGRMNVMGHNHDHSHTQNKKVLLLAFIFITGFMIVEAIGGFLTNSLALLSDAGHMLSDSISLGLALLAFIIAERAATAAKTYGYKRIEILASTVNGLTLILIAVYIIYEAIGRFANPPEVATLGMLIISSLGLIVNIVVAWMMMRGSDTKENLNMRGAYLHVLSDILGSVGAIVAALLMMGFGWQWADPLASVIVAVLVLRSGILLTKSSVHVLMENSPKNVDVEAIVRKIADKDGVRDVADVHVWTVTSGLNAFTCRVAVDGKMTVSESSAILDDIEHELQHANIQHTTIQLVDAATLTESNLWCDVEVEASHDHHHHH